MDETLSPIPVCRPPMTAFDVFGIATAKKQRGVKVL